ncbi:MAG: CaiB/BaiF CoA transferase family protein [Promethearchaeota archaeon]
MALKPIEGIRVLDLTKLLPGPYCTMILGDLGAEVIKVEHPDPMKDMARLTPPFIVNQSSKSRVGLLFYLINRNKKSITLNYQKPAGREIFLKLVKDADVVVESFRPGTLKHFGIDLESLKEVNPRIILCSVSGYGQTGPRAREPGHDMNYTGLAGLNHQAGLVDSPPGTFPVPFGDFIGSLYSVIGVLSGLIMQLGERLRGGKRDGGDDANMGGSIHVDASIFESVLSLHPVFEKFGRVFEKGEMALSGEYPFYRIYECKDGRHVVLGAIEQKFWNNFCDSINRPSLKHEQMAGIEYLSSELGMKSTMHYQEINLILERVFKERTAEEWVELLNKNDICCSPVLTLDEVWDDKQVKARHVKVPVKDPRYAAYSHVRSPILFNGYPLQISPMPTLGEHNAEIYRRLGFTDDEVKRLKRKRII